MKSGPSWCSTIVHIYRTPSAHYFLIPSNAHSLCLSSLVPMEPPGYSCTLPNQWTHKKGAGVNSKKKWTKLVYHNDVVPHTPEFISLTSLPPSSLSHTHSSLVGTYQSHSINGDKEIKVGLHSCLLGRRVVQHLYTVMYPHYYHTASVLS